MPRTPYNETLASKIPPDVFELPDGNRVDLRLARYTIPELNMNCSPLRSEYPDIKSIPDTIKKALFQSLEQSQTKEILENWESPFSIKMMLKIGLSFPKTDKEKLVHLIYLFLHQHQNQIFLYVLLKEYHHLLTL